jgi:hypothetical protein
MCRSRHVSFGLKTLHSFILLFIYSHAIDPTREKKGKGGRGMHAVHAVHAVLMQYVKDIDLHKSGR